MVAAIVLERPAEFDAEGDKDTIARDAFVVGTALSAPGPPLVVLAVLAWVAQRRDRWQWLGLGGAMLACLVFTIGYAGEPDNQAVVRGDLDWPVLVFGLPGFLLVVALGVVDVAAIRERLERPRAPGP